MIMSGRHAHNRRERSFDKCTLLILQGKLCHCSINKRLKRAMMPLYELLQGKIKEKSRNKGGFMFQQPVMYWLLRFSGIISTAGTLG